MLLDCGVDNYSIYCIPIKSGTTGLPNREKALMAAAEDTAEM